MSCYSFINRYVHINCQQNVSLNIHRFINNDKDDLRETDHIELINLIIWNNAVCRTSSSTPSLFTIASYDIYDITIEGGQQTPYQQPMWNPNAMPSFPTPSPTAYVPPAVADPLSTYASQVNTVLHFSWLRESYTVIAVSVSEFHCIL